MIDRVVQIFGNLIDLCIHFFLTIIGKGMLEYASVIVDLSISSFNSGNFCFMYVIALY